MDINRRLNLPTPSPNLQRILYVSDNILVGEIELNKYAERVPHSEEWNINVLDGPNARNGLLTHLRAENLPDPEAMWRQACVREPYLIGNGALERWFYANLTGALEPRGANERAAGGLLTKRCSYCGSQFLGFPLVNHSESLCGILRLLPQEFWLHFAIANHHAFCGYCCSRSSRHSRCDKARRCTSCDDPSHQQFHGVCEMARGQTPEAFQRYVLGLREKRYLRIQWLYVNGHLGFPLPTDYVPSGVLQNLEHMHRAGLRVKGVGPLPPPAAERFEHLPMCHYRGRRYAGLVNPEMDSDLLLQPVFLNEEDSRVFMILERRARARYDERRAQGYRQYLRLFLHGQPWPVFPVDMDVPGVIRRAPELEAPLVLEERNQDQAEPMANAVADEAEAEAAEANVTDPMEELSDSEVTEDSDSDLSESGPSDLSNIPEQENQVDIHLLVTDFRELLITSPPRVDNQLMRSLAPVTMKSFDKVVNDLRSTLKKTPSEEMAKQLFQPGTAAFVKKELDFEFLLRRALIAEIGQFHLMSASGSYYSFFIPEAVVTVLAPLETPTDSQCLSERIRTWQVLVSGSLDDSKEWETVPRSIKEEYIQFLRVLALSLQGQYVFTQLARPPFHPGLEVKGIPSITTFQDAEVRDAMNVLKSAKADVLASLNVHEDGFPYDTLVRARDVGEFTEEQEETFENDLRRVIKQLNTGSLYCRYRAEFASSDTLKHVLAHALPSSKDALVKRVRIIHSVFGWYRVEPSFLDDMAYNDIKSYSQFLVLIVQAMLGLSKAGKTTIVKESGCILEVIHGASTSLDFIIPTPVLFLSHPFGFWKVWLSLFLIPTAKRVVKVTCCCAEHNQDVQEIDS